MANTSKSNVTGTVAMPKYAKVQLTKWTGDQPITKRIRLNADGKIEKDSTAAQLYKGQVNVVSCTPSGFVSILKKIGPTECLSYGVPKNKDATAVTTQREFEKAGKPSHMMARTATASTLNNPPKPHEHRRAGGLRPFANSHFNFP